MLTAHDTVVEKYDERSSTYSAQLETRRLTHTVNAHTGKQRNRFRQCDSEPSVDTLSFYDVFN